MSTTVGTLARGVALGSLIPKEEMNLVEIDLTVYKLLQWFHCRAGPDAHGKGSLISDCFFCQLLDSVYNKIAYGTCEDIALYDMDTTAIWKYS